ncbi:putative RNA-directed DNA polymerase from transposon BS [Collichthys lucidus]|uniref:Putative RNA-directed DNA polymerase from transposon BS n=1 Tax=Collichthys lucidus TaxID=240159 RepID=A0A4U5TVZ9_COLLU|nr:putative RNA-directed DNA polymerase from transposon BS [Collichthys lucidus]
MKPGGFSPTQVSPGFWKSILWTGESKVERPCWRKVSTAYNQRKGVSGRSLQQLRTFYLCSVFLRRSFNLSLSLEKVPALWKTSCVVPVPKTPRPKEPNHFRPVALTSHLMKTMERIILQHLRPLVGAQLDPLQFADQPGIGVEDAVIYLLHRSLLHLEDSRSTVRVMFFDFSSAFNTIQPSLLRVKMESAPQGTVLSPFLFTLYTSDFTHNTAHCHIQKFSDDTAVVGRVSEGDDLEYRTIIRDFVSWCELNQLQLNTSKTKEMIVNYQRKTSHFTPVNIQGSDIEEQTQQTDQESQLVLDRPLDSTEEVEERRMLAQLTSIMDNTSHPYMTLWVSEQLHQQQTATPTVRSSSFSSRLLHPRCKKEEQLLQQQTATPTVYEGGAAPSSLLL